MASLPVTVTREMLNWPAMANVEHAIRCNPNSGMVLHWDGGKMRLSDKAHGRCIEYWRDTRHFHMTAPDHRWIDIGYAWGVCPHGGRFEGRGWGWVQAAQPGGNSTWESCTLMTGPGEIPTPEQILGVQLLRAELMKNRGMKADILPHSHFFATDCPGTAIRTMISGGVFRAIPGGSPAPEWTEKIVDSLPTLKKGVSSYDVKTVRGLLFARGYVQETVETGLVEFLNNVEFDDVLDTIVRQFQLTKKLVADGIVGPDTWTKLLRR